MHMNNISLPLKIVDLINQTTVCEALAMYSFSTSCSPYPHGHRCCHQHREKQKESRKELRVHVRSKVFGVSKLYIFF